MKNFTLEIPILNDELIVVVCWGSKKYLSGTAYKYYYGKYELCFDGDERGVTFIEKDKHPVILLPNAPRTPEEIGTLAHEAVHAVRHVFRSAHEKGGAEVFSHSVGAVVRKVLEKI